MISLVISSILFIFGLICTLISPKKLATLFRFQSFHQHNNNGKNHTTPSPPPVPIKTTTTATATAAAKGGADQLRGVFATFDKNNDGYITKQELRESLMNIGISAGERDVADMVEKVDFNGDGLIDFDEFCELFSGKRERDEEGGDGDLKEAFDVFDENKDGLITVEELGLVLSSLGFTQGKMVEDCKEMIRRVDVDGDGMVNFDEFKTMMTSGFGRLIPIS